jgi:hypothetical protein
MISHTRPAQKFYEKNQYEQDKINNVGITTLFYVKTNVIILLSLVELTNLTMAIIHLKNGSGHAYAYNFLTPCFFIISYV